MSRMRKMNDKGFTLVEIMLSIAILALISVPLMKYFSDSLRYAAQTAEKQKATLIAQETMETIRAQKKIVKPVTAATAAPGATVPPTTYNLAPELITMFGGYAGASATPTVIVPANFYSSGATGTDAAPEKLIYRYVDQRSGKYYMEASFQCTMDAASVSSPAILGIDDSRNVVIAERAEEADALTFFETANLNYYLAYSGAVIINASATPSPTPNGLIYITPVPGPTTTPGPDPRILTEDEIKAQMKRIIYVTVTKHTGDTYYNVKSNYVYFCDDVYGDGTGKLSRTSPDLVETNVQNLEGVYLMFNKFRPDFDDIVINWDVEGGAPGEYPDFRFIVQDDVAVAGTPDPLATTTPTVTPTVDPAATPTTAPTVIPTATPGPGGYSLRVSFMNITDALTVHGNLEATNFEFHNLNAEYTDPDEFAIVDGGTRDDVDVKALTGEGIPVRVFDVEIKVYRNKKAYDDHEDPLIELKSTKVE